MENSSPSLRYLTIEEILEAAFRHVGNYQLLKENQLNYLVEIVRAKYGDTELYPTLTQKAAVYAHHIITGHIFLDGNKRIGMTCTLWFLVLNGRSLLPNINDSIVELGVKIADGTIRDLQVIANRIESWLW